MTYDNGLHTSGLTLGIPAWTDRDAAALELNAAKAKDRRCDPDIVEAGWWGVPVKDDNGWDRTAAHSDPGPEPAPPVPAWVTRITDEPDTEAFAACQARHPAGKDLPTHTTIDEITGIAATTGVHGILVVGFLRGEPRILRFDRAACDKLRKVLEP